MREAAYAQHYYRELQRQLSNEELDQQARAEALRHLLIRLFEEATRPERLHFTTLYARIAYTGHKYGFTGAELFHLHRFRFFDRPDTEERLSAEEAVALGAKVLVHAIRRIYDQPVPDGLQPWAERPWIWNHERSRHDFHSEIRLVALEDDPAAQQLIVREEDHPEQQLRLNYGGAQQHEHLGTTIAVMRQVTGFPVVLNALNVEVAEDGSLTPRLLILEPDYLIDVTAVAESFHGNDMLPWGYLAKKFLPYELSGPLLRGQIANHFLDALVHNPETTYQELRKTIFALNPLGICSLPQGELQQIMGELQRHYLTIKGMAVSGLARQSIEPADCYLEPSFYSPTYGMQGRLDLLHRAPDRTAIVELKSGSVFRANRHGVGASHYIQTLMYDLLIRGAFGGKEQVASYILYSGQQQEPLRFAPREKQRQQESLQIRNQLLAIDFLLTMIGRDPQSTILEQTNRLFHRLRPAAYPWLKGFTRNDLDRIERTYGQLSDRERTYLGAYAGFTAREHRLAKTGEQGAESVNGLASLWLDDPQDKDERFERLAGLAYAGPAEGAGEESLLNFRRGEATSTLAKFRVGDIAVLYPAGAGDDRRAVCRNQVFKCTLVEIDDSRLTVRLRSRQSNDQFFRSFPAWTVEKDLLDSGFVGYYRSLYAWAESPVGQRRRWLGLDPPAGYEPAAIDRPDGMTAQQFDILRRIVAAPDYFLLWGPPGTGKTTVMLHHLVHHLLEHSNENLLLLAYTNRAVDEICESIERIGNGFRQYLRIGSRYGTAARYQDRLLQVLTERIHTRQELRELLDSHRIVVGTVASMAGRTELFHLKRFDRIVIDEASQILEPMIMGLLPRAPRVLLIGDHRQLPAVVAQSPEDTRTDDPLLTDIGLRDLSTSLFERLFLRAQEKQWHHAYAMLTYQGRMHHSIMAFPSRHFYDDQLQILPDGIAHRLTQEAPLQLQLPAEADETLALLAGQRLVFYPTPTDRSSTDYKTNRHEAELLVRLVQFYESLYRVNGEPLADRDIGIITPYRAQIALIRSHLAGAGLDPDHYTVDTVERYQGGARRIILLSLCTNAPHQVQTLSRLSQEGVDRKLNVAMTRAREHLVILGHPGLLEQQPVYHKLIEHCRNTGGYVEVAVSKTC